MQQRTVHEVTSNQADIYENLEETVIRYVSTEYRRPFAEHTVKAFGAADAFVRAAGCPVVLDSGCGTGRSSFALAARFPECVVVAVDKSEVRLSKSSSLLCDKDLLSRILFVRAELLDFWRLALSANWNIVHHAVFYPNPWPKSSEATRRFHLSPVFPAMLKLSPVTELRTNWEIYAREFAEAANIAGSAMELELSVNFESFVPLVPETAFEEKYFGAGQKLYRTMVVRKD